MLKNCKRCNQSKPVDQFSKSPSNKGGYATLCKPCVAARNKDYWSTPIGRMSKIYATQVSSSKARSHPPPDYTREELTVWALNQGLTLLILNWEASNRDKNLIPSVDRKDPNKPYTLNNIRLVTWAENNEKAYEDRKECRHITAQNRRVEQLALDGTHIAYHDSIAHASRKTGITRTNINGMCKGKPNVKSVGGFIWRYA